ncbi:MAG: periplasmic heavy metal sensor [Verrucomicrobiota bacterium]
MKKVLLSILLGLVAGLLAFYLMRSHRLAARDGVLLDSMPELSWVRTDLKATDSQMAKVTELHLAYRPKCEEMCRRITAAHAKVEALARANRGMTPELDAAIREHAETHAQCQQAMLEHIYRTAALLDPEQATRYMETVLPIALELTPGADPRPE